MRRAHVAALVLLLAIGAVTAIVLVTRWEPAGTTEDSAPPPPDGTQTTATPVPAPRAGACARLDYAEAVELTPRGGSVPCSQPHTAQTFLVGSLDLVVDGRLLAVDSERAQGQAATTCRDAVAGHVGATPEELRLSMVEAVWFTPGVEGPAEGADWLRCDVVAVSGGRRLVELPRASKGMLAAESTRDDYAMCGTAQPSADGFSRVVCSARHSWRAVASVDLPGAAYPSADKATDVMEPRCREVARDRADDPLDFTWAEERPTREQWQAGRRYGLCWVPD
jgi:hypothetical protein